MIRSTTQRTAAHQRADDVVELVRITHRSTVRSRSPPRSPSSRATLAPNPTPSNSAACDGRRLAVALSQVQRHANHRSPKLPSHVPIELPNTPRDPTHFPHQLQTNRIDSQHRHLPFQKEKGPSPARKGEAEAEALSHTRSRFRYSVQPGREAGITLPGLSSSFGSHIRFHRRCHSRTRGDCSSGM